MNTDKVVDAIIAASKLGLSDSALRRVVIDCMSTISHRDVVIPPWVTYAANGRKIDAIKLLRETHSARNSELHGSYMGLKMAKDIVESFVRVP